MIRFSAFAPVLVSEERLPATKPAISFEPTAYEQPAAVRQSPLDQIRAIEEEWRERIQPSGTFEQTICAQLAHATWHLKSLQEAEREAILAAAMNRGLNGDSAVSLMSWRLSAEAAIRNALEQLESYRRILPIEPSMLPEQLSLFALAQATKAEEVESHRLLN